ncbi:MAG: V-type ATPase subunit [Actinomycetota bacterium]|nr:V-type ATPase subunit [Actinomycetota bacterium]
MEKTLNIELKKYELADDSDYLYTCAELKVREQEFIDNSKLERMVGSKEVDDFLKVLQETVHSKKIALIDDDKNMDLFILKSYEETIDFLQKRLQEKHMIIIYVLFMEEYLNNFKLILKSSLLNINLENLFIPLTFSYEELSEYMKKDISYEENFDNNAVLQPIIFKTIIKELINIKNKTLQEIETGKESKINFRKIEIDFERKFISAISNEILKTGSTMLCDYLKHWIDIQNLKNMNRIKYIGENLKYADFLYPGGMIDIDSLKTLEFENPDYWVKALEKSCYGEIIIKGIHSLYSYNTFFSFEKNESIFYLKFFDSIKYCISNVEKIFAFFLRKKIELIVVNMIYMGIKYHAEKRNISHKAEFLSES